MNYNEANKKYKLEHIQGWMDNCDMIWLFEKAKEMKNANIVEIGCWKGKSTGAIISGLSLDNKISCIDSWIGEDGVTSGEYSEAEKAFEIFKNNISKFNLKPNIIKKSSLDAANDFEEKSVDWIFLDADHSVEGVMRDLSVWKGKIKDGGLLSGHDWQFDTVKNAIKKFGLKVDGYTTEKLKDGRTVGSIWWSIC